MSQMREKKRRIKWFIFVEHSAAFKRELGLSKGFAAFSLVSTHSAHICFFIAVFEDKIGNWNG